MRVIEVSKGNDKEKGPIYHFELIHCSQNFQVNLTFSAILNTLRWVFLTG
jgi:hypothetical protein